MFQVSIYMYKAKHGMLPDCCSVLVPLVNDNLRYNFRNKHDFQKIKFFSNIRRKIVAVAGPHIWNSIPACIKSSLSISVFKTKLMNLMLDSYVKVTV